MTNELGIYTSENNRLVVSSRDIARVFEKEHFNVIRDIKNLECNEEFNAINFEAVDYTDAKGKNLSSRLTAIQNEADKLKDVCMLGDADELLEKLASFEKKEF